MGLKAYFIIPRSGGGFHFGREGLDQEVSVETFPSDSLFAALVAAAFAVDEHIGAGELLTSFLDARELDDVPFRISSLFPRAGELPLLPMPKVRIIVEGAEDRGRGKILKKIAYVSPGILHLLLNETAVDQLLPSATTPAEGLMLQDGKVWITQDERSLLPKACHKVDWRELREWPIWRNDTVPRVTIDRRSNSSSIYQVGRTAFNADCGLWLLADVNYFAEHLEYLLDILGDQGLGGERSAGYGGFTVEPFDPPTLPASGRSDREMTLARYNPRPEEITAGVLGDGASYELVDVGGWLSTPGGPAQRRKRVRMIEAGSILAAPCPIIGRVVDVRPEYDQPGAPPHPVYRSGIALTIGMRGGAS